MVDLEAIEARYRAATPGFYDMYKIARHGQIGFAIHGTGGRSLTDKDGEFFAGACEDVPAMAREIRRLRAALERVLELHDEAHDTPDADGSPTDPPDVVCRMRWVAFSELEVGETPWWDMPYAAGSEIAAERKALG